MDGKKLILKISNFKPYKYLRGWRCFELTYGKHTILYYTIRLALFEKDHPVQDGNSSKVRVFQDNDINYTYFLYANIPVPVRDD